MATSPAIGVFPAEVDKSSNKITPEFRESISRDHRENATGIEPTVPKVLSQLRQWILGKMDQGGIKGKLAKLVTLNAARHLRCRVQGKHRPLTRLLYHLLAPARSKMSRIVKTLFAQEKFDVFISGGAALPIETDTFFWALGIPILEGYGSAETNCPVFINRLGEFGTDYMNGTVGYAIAPDVRTRLDPETGEVLISAPCLRCGDPINVRERLEQHRGEPQDLAGELVVEFRRRMQAKLDELIALSQPVTQRFARPNPFPAAHAPSGRPLDFPGQEAAFRVSNRD